MGEFEALCATIEENLSTWMEVCNPSSRWLNKTDSYVYHSQPGWYTRHPEAEPTLPATVIIENDAMHYFVNGKLIRPTVMRFKRTDYDFRGCQTNAACSQREHYVILHKKTGPQETERNIRVSKSDTKKETHVKVDTSFFTS